MMEQQEKIFAMDEEGTLDTVEYTLINLVRGYPELYSGHRDKPTKDRAWAAIARQLNKEEIWCYSKWRNLADYYKKKKKQYDSGGGTRQQRWVYYDALSFLDLYGRDNFSENSLSSIRSAEEHSFDDGSNNPNYFNETQYHSLDGVTERALIAGESRERDATQPRLNLNDLPDPLSDSNYIPPTKRQRGGGPSAPVRINYTSSVPAASSSVVPHLSTEPDEGTSFGNGINEAPRISKVRSTKDKDLPLAGQELAVTTPNADPHYHFCMSLAERFRQMDAGAATYLQMKIMELLLKTEYPNEYQKRRNDS